MIALPSLIPPSITTLTLTPSLSHHFYRDTATRATILHIHSPSNLPHEPTQTSVLYWTYPIKFNHCVLSPIVLRVHKLFWLWWDWMSWNLVKCLTQWLWWMLETVKYVLFIEGSFFQCVLLKGSTVYIIATAEPCMLRCLWWNIAPDNV
jgi:hypothetical protein